MEKDEKEKVVLRTHQEFYCEAIETTHVFCVIFNSWRCSFSKKVTIFLYTEAQIATVICHAGPHSTKECIKSSRMCVYKQAKSTLKNADIGIHTTQ